jgi:hypothetical protein
MCEQMRVAFVVQCLWQYFRGVACDPLVFARNERLEVVAKAQVYALLGSCLPASDLL